MSEEKKYHSFTAADIEKYHKGLLSSKEMNELEKAALDDPFLADALEGYGATSVNRTTDLLELEKKLQERVSRGKVISMTAPHNSFKWWRVAAAVVVIGGVGFFTYRISTNNRNNKVAQVEPKDKSNDQAAVPVTDTNKLTTQGNAALVDSVKETTLTLSNAKRKSSNTFLNATTDKTTKDVASASTSLPLSSKRQYSDTIENQQAATVNTYALEKAAPKKPETDNRQLQGVAAGVELRDQQKINYFRGRVVDENNNPLPFANITNTKDNVGTYADAKGNFTLISPDSTLNVQIRSVGFQNNLARLRDNAASNQVVMQEEEVSPDKVISSRKQNADLYRKAIVTLEEPEPADGWDNYGVYLANNINLPDDFKKKEADNGHVQLSFEVNQNGDPVNIKVEKSLCQKCDEEAVRLVKEGPKWKKKNKKNNRVTISVPFDTHH